MFEKFFKNIIIDAFKHCIEDFTDNDIQIDQWNGVVVKENAVFKKNTLEMFLKDAIQAPIYV
jgi:hypothetical protein